MERPVEFPVEIALPVTRIVTASSVWLIDPDCYVRLPRREAPRRPPESWDPAAFADAEQIAHRAVLWHRDPNETSWRIRIVPAHRPLTSAGVLTGGIEEASIPIPGEPTRNNFGEESFRIRNN